MLKFLLLTLTLSTTALAAGPFGKYSKKLSKYGLDQSNCSAEIVVRNTMNESGINLADGSGAFIWECKKGADGGSQTARERRCPYDQYMASETYKCYSNATKGENGYPYACVSEARSEDVKEEYSGEKPQLIPRPRFKQLFLVKSENKGSTYTMDPAGCKVTAARHDTPNTLEVEEAECVEMLRNATSNGFIYPPRDGRPGVKFCENGGDKKSQMQDYLHAAEKIVACREAYPNLADLAAVSTGRVPGKKSTAIVK